MKVIKMSIDQKMEYLRKALELGADIDISFHNCDEKEKAEKIINTMGEFVQVPYREHHREGTHWFNIKDYDNCLNTSVFFEEKEEEATI